MQGQLRVSDFQNKKYRYNTPANVIIKELSRRYDISLSDAEKIEKRLEKIGLIEISAGDELFHSDFLQFEYLTINTRNGLSSTSRKPFNVIINLKDGMIEEIAPNYLSPVSVEITDW